MATPRFNSKNTTIKRILREAQELSTTPSPDFHAAPASDSDLFDWHFTLRGPPSSPFASGAYHGRIVLPPAYPLRPPMFRFLTPSGRFEVNREICLSISGHHEETWSPSWGIRTALTALRAFMETDVKGQLGGMECTAGERERLAGSSQGWRCGVCQRSNKEILDESAEAARKMEEENGELAHKEEEVPKELKAAYTDEKKMAEASSSGDGDAKTEKEKEGEDEAQLAEGFVKTGNVADTTETTNPNPAAAPAQTVPQPTRTIPPPAALQPRVTAAPTFPPVQRIQQVQVRSNDGVPLWLDRTIAVVVLCLVAMVLKVLFGL